MSISDVKIANATTIEPVVPQPENPLRGYPRAKFEDIPPAGCSSVDSENAPLTVKVVGMFTPVLTEVVGMPEIPRRVELRKMSAVPDARAVFAAELWGAAGLIRPGNRNTSIRWYVVVADDAYYCGIRDGGEIYVRHCWCKIDPELKAVVNIAIAIWIEMNLSDGDDGARGGI
ncbi:MAG: hypothetical protein QGG42_15700 [Phycisphaerae bacterium]|jgi:hypothetical protein|nr:hypothetical protein [Phycisphaerae bacterium]